MQIPFLIFTTLLAVLLELQAGSLTLFLPLVANLIIYFTIAYSWRSGLFVALVGGVSLDLLFGRSGYYTAFATLCVVPIAYGWDRAKLNSPLFFNLILGLLLPAYTILIIWGVQKLCGASSQIFWSRELFSQLIFAGVLNAIMMLLAIIFLDIMAEWLDLSCFQDRERRRKSGEEEEI